MTNSQDSHRLTPAEAAKELTVGAQTIRRWCEWHAAYLSKGANPPAGAPRYLLWQDIEVFKTVKTMREEGLPTHTINERLESMVFPIIDTPLPTQEHALTTQPQADAPADNQMAITVMSTLSTVLQRMDAMEQRYQDSDKQKRDARIIFFFGLLAGIFLMFGFILVALGLYR